MIKAIPQLDQVASAIDAIKMKQNTRLLAYWPSYGCATFDQLDAMSSIIEARIHFSLVIRTTESIDNVEWRMADLRAPFEDTRHVTKNEYNAYVETLNLGANRIPGEWLGIKYWTFVKIFGFKQHLCYYRYKCFKMSTRTLGSSVQSTTDSLHLSKRGAPLRVLARTRCGSSAFIGVLNTGFLWVTFYIDLENKGCFMFDPLQEEANYKTIKKSMTRIIEGVLEMEGLLEYKELSGCKQRDGSSCGVWCIAILEILLSDETWDDCMYNLLPYLRMRFLYKAIAFIGKTEGIQS
ncbi:LOW QUALITY PROTEIN: hypothetical protein PHMEG_00024427 [Phytophthora megakarya]|uniref:Ubiquitin-like protease family profile domain-containing protein n=1 Tax=Phytophthora megakarya TaxID=4795 RepID=A0A225VG90_9STRA|nr:LOW QUALITY PROTEIN: hypothetical protein PHMEG_00024427 [Phytophthora megakarya]